MKCTVNWHFIISQSKRGQREKDKSGYTIKSSWSIVCVSKRGRIIIDTRSRRLIIFKCQVTSLWTSLVNLRHCSICDEYYLIIFITQWSPAPCKHHHSALLMTTFRAGISSFPQTAIVHLNFLFDATRFAIAVQRCHAISETADVIVPWDCPI